MIYEKELTVKQFLLEGIGRKANISKTSKFQLLRTQAPMVLKSFTKSG